LGVKEKCSPSGIKFVAPVDLFFGFLSIHSHDHHDSERLHSSEFEPEKTDPALPPLSHVIGEP
jgi:hypothetical protein